MKKYLKSLMMLQWHLCKQAPHLISRCSITWTLLLLTKALLCWWQNDWEVPITWAQGGGTKRHQDLCMSLLNGAVVGGISANPACLTDSAVPVTPFITTWKPNKTDSFTEVYLKSLLNEIKLYSSALFSLLLLVMLTFSGFGKRMCIYCGVWRFFQL